MKGGVWARGSAGGGEAQGGAGVKGGVWSHGSGGVTGV